MTALSRWISALFREPLVHFALIGALVLAVHAKLERPPHEQIVVSAAFVQGLRDEHQEHTGRAPTPDEERGLIDNFIDEEVLHREAIALGLDQGDVIVRRRLAQKMQFLLEDGGAASEREPSAEEIRAYIDAHPERYRGAEATSFRHVFFSRDKYGDRLIAEASRALEAVKGGADPGVLGDPFLQGATWTMRTGKEIEATFGADFAGQVAQAAPGAWSGPITSSYGAHLVFVTERSGARAPSQPALEARARSDLRALVREESIKMAKKRLRARYKVVVEAGEGGR